MAEEVGSHIGHSAHCHCTLFDGWVTKHSLVLSKSEKFILMETKSYVSVFFAP